MPNLILDTVERSQVEKFGNVGGRIVRTGVVTDVDVTNDKERLLWECLNVPGLPAMGAAHPSNPAFLLNRVVAEGINERSARLFLHYEPFSANAASALVITTGSRLTTYQTNLHPGSNKPLYVDVSDGDNSIPADLVTFNLLKAQSTASVFKLQIGTIDPANAASQTAKVGHVNSNTWLGRAKGSWLITDYEVVNSKYAGYYTTRATAMTAGPAPQTWMTAAVLFQRQYGKYYWYEGIEDDIRSQIDGGYVYTADSNVNSRLGWAVIGPYPLADFNAVFGF